MSTWAQAVKQGTNPWAKLDDPKGTGVKLPGQGDLTSDNRKTLKSNLDAYTARQGESMSEQTHGGKTSVTDEMVSAARINQCYDSFDGGDEGKEAYLEAAAKMPLGDMDDPAQRLKTLSFITQDVAGHDSAKDGQEENPGANACSGASIVGAAFLAEGPAGLTKVISAIEKFDPDKLTSDKYASPEYTALKQKLKDDPSGKTLTMKDIQTLQQTTSQVLNTNDPGDLKKTPQVANVTMDKFMEHSPELAKTFKDNGMEIEFIDNDGEAHNGGRTADHYVLKIKGQDGGWEMIYDPKARRGGQVIDFEYGVQQYDKARVDTIGDPFKPYAT